MKRADFLLIAFIGIALAILFLLGAAFLYFYDFYTSDIGYWEQYPYRQHAAGPFVAGIILFVIGVAFLWRAEQEEATER